MDWAITDEDSRRVIGELLKLSDGDLLDTYNHMQKDGLWSTLYEQAPKYDKPWRDLRLRLVGLGQPVLRSSAEDKQLAKLHSALSASKRAIQAAAFVTEDPKLQSQMAKAAKQFGLAASTLDKGMKVVSATKAVYKLSRAAAALNNIDVRKDGEAAAKAFGALFSASGELGKLLPPGPWTPYFDFLTGFDDFFSNMRKKFDPRNRGGGRFRHIMPK